MDRQAAQVELFVIEGHEPMSAASLPALLPAIEHDDDCESEHESESEHEHEHEFEIVRTEARCSEPFPLISGAS
jgi:hypothetical protein